MSTDKIDIVIIGAGQAGLAAGYHLQRAGLPFVILEERSQPGGSWPEYYDSLKLFSPRRYSCLPGFAMPGDPDGYPNRDEVTTYLRAYAQHFTLPVIHGMRVEAVRAAAGTGFVVEAANGHTWRARAVIVAAGSFRRPRLPVIRGQEVFRGRTLHSMDYRNPEPFSGLRVVVVGAGNSAVQIAVELDARARVTLATRRPVRFMPQRILGRDIHFWLRITGLDRRRWASDQSAAVIDTSGYRAALAQGRPPQRAMFEKFTPDGVVWPDGSSEAVDAVVFATGFLQEFPFLASLPKAITQRRGVSLEVPGLYFVGSSGQTGLASATLRGVGPDAAEVVRAIHRRLEA